MEKLDQMLEQVAYSNLEGTYVERVNNLRTLFKNQKRDNNLSLFLDNGFDDTSFDDSNPPFDDSTFEDSTDWDNSWDQGVTDK